jgi:hypothetical protein
MRDNSIKAQRTKTVTYYIFYNPGNIKDSKNKEDPGKFVLDSIKTADPAARKIVDDVLKQLKLTLGNKAFEAYSFPEFGMAPLVVYTKPK